MSSALAMNAARGQVLTARRRRFVLRRRLALLGVLLLTVMLTIAAVGQAGASPVAGPRASMVPPMMSAAGTGTGGSFVPLQARLADTRNGTGGYSTPLTAASWRSYQVAGVGAIPSTGVASVVVTVTSLNPTAAGNISLAPNTSLPAAPLVFLAFDAADTVSNTGVIDVGTDGKIAIRSGVSTDALIDIQGYFTTGAGTAPGGYVSANNRRIVDSRAGAGNIGLTGPLTTNTTYTVTATGGSTGIPTTATAIYANITVITTNTTGNYVTPYPTGTTKPATSLNYDGSATAGATSTTALGTTVDVNASGQFNLYIGPAGGSVEIVIDVQGYFDGQPSASGFTPVTSRLYDSRISPGVTLAANSTTSIQVGGAGGIPAGAASLAGVAINVQSFSATSTGSLRVWPGDQIEPGTSNLNYLAGDHSSSLSIVQPAVSDGTIKIRNISAGTVNIALDAEGYFTNPSVLPPAVGISPIGSGARKGAAMISHKISDRVNTQVNPINGNLVVTQSLFSLTGVGQSASVNMRYNALNDNRPTLNVGLFEAQLYRDASNTVFYTGPDGAAYAFTPGGGPYTGKIANGTTSTALYGYSTPNGANASLYRVGAATSGPGIEYDLTFHPSQMMYVYVDDGSNIKLTATQDVTGANKITYAYTGGKLSTQTDTQGRTITYGYNDPNNPTQPSAITDNSLGRTVSLTYGGPSGALSKIVDATGVQTLYGYNGSGKLSSITNGRGYVTAFTYDGTNRLASLTAASGTPAPSTWSMTYPTAATRQWTDPNAHFQNYNITGTGSAALVTSIQDANGNTQASGYNSHFDVTSATSGTNDQTSFAYATSTYNLMSATSPKGGQGTSSPGRVQSYVYNPSPTIPYTTADFRPTSATDTDSNSTAYTYNNFGEAIRAVNAGGGVGTAGTTTHTYQSDNQGTPGCGGKTGQLCSITDGKGNVTGYAYNAAGNLITMTPPTPLGAHTFTYDAAGRKISEQDGRGNTAYTCYDNDDRITQVNYSTANCATTAGVTYTYDANGNVTSRATVSTGTTTSWTFDNQDRPTQETDSSGTTNVSWDPAGNVLTYVDGGTTSYAYDKANNLISLAEPGGICPAAATTGPPIATPNTTGCTGFTYNPDNQRIGTYLPNGVTNTVSWDASGRPLTTKAAKGAATSVDRAYVYDNSGADSGLLRKIVDYAANTTTGYGYNAANRLAAANVTSGIIGGGTAISSDAYTYDYNGNITQQVTAGTTTNYGYNAADEMCWSGTGTSATCTAPPYADSYTYDGNGNTLTGDVTTGTNTWSLFNQLGSSSTGGSTSYSYQGTTNAQRVSAGPYTFSNGILGQVTHRAGGSNNQQYIRDPQGTLIAIQTGGASYYYTLDNIGSVLQLTDSAGNNAATYKYGPYGRTLTATGSQASVNPYRYASGYTDTTNLIKFGARYYNPTLTRFTQPDPSGQETNRYAYTVDNPISNNDPSGLEPCVAGTADEQYDENDDNGCLSNEAPDEDSDNYHGYGENVGCAVVLLGVVGLTYENPATWVGYLIGVGGSTYGYFESCYE